MSRSTEGLAAGRHTGRAGHRDHGAGQGLGEPGPGAAQPGQALLCRAPPGQRTKADLEPASSAV